MFKTWDDVMKAVSDRPKSLVSCVFSKPLTERKTLRVRKILLGNSEAFQASWQVGNKQIQLNVPVGAEVLYERLTEWSTDYLQAEIYTMDSSFLCMRGKKGRETVIVRGMDAERVSVVPKSHDRVKEYILPRGKRVDFLVALGVMNGDGTVRADKQRKFVQINRFLEMVDDVADRLPGGKLRIIDFGCGKAYLTFALYYYFTEIKKRNVEIIGLDLKEDVIKTCADYAREFGMEGLKFQVGDIGGYSEDSGFDMMVSLHACDTATDAALERAVRWGVSVVLAVPCCQHELRVKIENGMLEPILGYGLLRERFAALLTDGLRAQILMLLGYSVSVIEFVDDSHTPKNLMIRGVKTNTAPTREQIIAYNTLVKELDAENHLHRALKDKLTLLGI